MKHRWTRRDVLRAATAAGATTLLPPFPGTTWAQAAPKRLVIMATFNGTVPDAFFPRAEGTGFSLPRILEPLEPFRDELLIVQGLDIKHRKVGAHDGQGALLTNRQPRSGDRRGSGISIDAFLGDRLGGLTLLLGVRHPNFVRDYTRALSYAGSYDPIPVENDPYQISARIFADTEEPMASARPMRRAARRARVLEHVRGELAAARAWTPARDGRVLQRHAEVLNRLEQKLNTAGQVSCMAPPLGNPVDPNQSRNYPTVGRLQTDVLVAALACNATRVATLTWGGPTSQQTFPWLGINEGHHTLSHDGGATEELITINHWYAQQFAYLIDQAKKTVDLGGSTVFDNTLFLWLNPLASGAHGRNNIPVLLAGGGWHFRLGQHVRFRGEPHGRLLVNVLHAMGLADETSFGEERYSAGPLPNLT